MGRIVANKYEVLGTLGSGGTGAVLEAQHLTLSNRRVALKHLHERYRSHEGLVERFIREAQTADALDHPHIVEIVDVEQDDELGPVLVMELLEGRGLDELRDDGPMVFSRACHIVAQALDALGLAHRAGIVHRDLKPANLVLLDRAGRDHVKIVDFGIAHVANEHGLTVPGHFFGTPRYASPEQRVDASAVGPAADVYAMGVTLLELIKGERAARSSESSIDARVVVDVAADTLPEPIRGVITRAVAHDPADRYPDAEAMRDALDEALMDVAGAPLPPSTIKLRGDPSEVVAAAVGPRLAPRGETPTRVDATPSARRERPRDSTVLSEHRAPSPADGEGRSGPPLWAVGLGVAAIVGVGAYASTSRAPAVPPSAWVAPGASSTPTSEAADEPALGPRERAIARRACEVWADALSKHQQPDGRFGTEAHRTPSGWTTGQMLAGLSASHRACGKPGTSPLMKGLRALETGRAPEGWHGVGSDRAETPATAWALLALAGAGPALGDARALEMAERAASLILEAQTKEGGFAFLRNGPDGVNDYTTVLATWALVDAESASAEAVPDRELGEALAWLETVLTHDRGEPPLRRVAGLQEQAVWVWLRARAAGMRNEGDAGVGATVARDIIERCQLDGGHPRRCTRPIYEDGRTYLDRTDKGPNLLTLWHPWVVTAANALHRDASLDLPVDERAALADIARWGLHELEAGVALIATAPGYKLAEYLIAVSDLLPRSPAE